MAFVFMLFLGIAIAGVMPMMIAELGHAQIQRNAVEAQFAAEAGLKRAVAAFVSNDTTWTWLNTASNLTNEAGVVKTYRVTSKPVINTGSPPPFGTYQLTSVGQVKGNSHTATVRIVRGIGGPFSHAIFSQQDLVVENNGIVNGSVGSNEDIIANNNADISGDAVAHQTITLGVNVSPENVLANQPLVELPTFAAANFAAATPLTSLTTNRQVKNITGGVYKVTGDFTMANLSQLNVSGNVTVYISGNLDLSNNSDITIASDSTLTFLVEGSATLINNSDQNKLLLIAKQDVDIYNNADLTGAAISLEGNLTLHNNGEVTYDSAFVLASLNNTTGLTTSGGTPWAGGVTNTTSQWFSRAY